MKVLALLIGLCLALVGCGGGGGGGSASQVFLSGLIINISTNGGANPATVTIGGVSVQTEADGFFGVEVPSGQTAMTVAWNSMSWDYTFPAAVDDRDLGIFFVGSQQISVTGMVKDQNDDSPIPGVTVTLAGVRATTGSDGVYSLPKVAYDSGQQATFFNLEGRAGKTGFFPRIFSPDTLPVGGVATLSDVFLQPDSGTVPPGTPYNIEGFVNPSNQGSGAIVDLKQGATVIRSFTTGSDRRYGFWVAPGSYTVTATKGTLTSGPIPVVLNSPGDTVQQNVTLN